MEWKEIEMSGQLDLRDKMKWINADSRGYAGKENNFNKLVGGICTQYGKKCLSFVHLLNLPQFIVWPCPGLEAKQS